MNKAHQQFRIVAMVGLALACAAELTMTAAAQTDQVPLINVPLAPGAALPGGKSFSLTINGTGFASGASVLWNGSALLTVVNSQSKLTATVPAADIATAGTAYVSVTNPKAAQSSNVLLFPVTNPSTAVAFANSDVATLNSPLVVGVADFNGDGNPDIAIEDGAGNIDVLPGHGDGTFSAPVVSSVGAARSAVIADINGDGNLDIITAQVEVFFGNGDGTFTAGPSYGGSFNEAISAGDFNGDGKLDLAASGSDGIGFFYVLLGNGDGTFHNGSFYRAGAAPPAVGDFNRDGKVDLGSTDAFTEVISVFNGNGNGTFQRGMKYATQTSNVVVTADFNGDGYLDLAATNSGYDTVLVMLGMADGTFGPPTTYAAGAGAFGLSVGDFNGDGKPDLLTANSPCCAESSVSILLGNGDGTFQSHIEYAQGTSFGATGDFNRDGKLDFVTVDFLSGVISVFLQSAAQLSATNLTFTEQAIGTTSPPQTITLTNAGNSTMTISGVAITGANSGDFAQTNACGTSLPAGASCAINVTFTPIANGTRSATLSISDSAVGSPQSVSLTGTGIQPTVVLSPTSLTFGLVVVGGSSQAEPVKLTNTGNGPLTVVSISTTGDFTQTNTCGSSVAAGASCTISVTFKPAAAGARTGTLSVTDNAPGSPQTVSLSGTGTAVKVSATSINFGSQEVGTTSLPVPVTIANTGTMLLQISGIKIGGADPEDFSESSNCGQSLGAGKSCTITVTFTPTVTGTRNASLGISDNGGGSPQRVALSGDGT